jgi:UDP-N-acetylglucosamine--N-acetylmuramyl-(pentapeptide) pyrophosphoryl-undecaprenol N-acetylglucosamine transferase
MRERKVIISGGGTGGHLYPALAVGKKLREKDPDLRLTFVGSRRSLEKELMERHGAHFVALQIEGIKGRGWRSLRAIVILPLAFFKSLALLLRLRPDLVIGVGGYSSGPVVLLASLLRIPTLILEQNLTPGFTNRVLARWTQRAVVAFESSVVHFKGKGVFLGNPVREEFYILRPKQRTRELTVLVFGGSQGSHVLNQVMTATLPHLAPRKDSLKIFHQTGPADFEWVNDRYVQSSFADAVVSPFFFDMAGYFEKSDLVVCRAGATTIAELITAQKAAVLVPFARASENHQAKNAQELVRLGGAEVILEKDLSPQGIAARILFYLDHKERITAMEKNLAALKTDRPADRIADLCFELMRTKAQEA